MFGTILTAQYPIIEKHNQKDEQYLPEYCQFARMFLNMSIPIYKSWGTFQFEFTSRITPGLSNLNLSISLGSDTRIPIEMDR